MTKRKEVWYSTGRSTPPMSPSSRRAGSSADGSLYCQVDNKHVCAFSDFGDPIRVSISRPVPFPATVDTVLALHLEERGCSGIL